MFGLISRVAAGILCLLLFTGVCNAGNEPYILVAAGDYVAVFETESCDLLYTDVRICTLPPSDRLLLEQGLPCENRTDVAAYLENFDF